MAARTLLLFLCFLLLLSTVAVYQVKAETIEEYKERINREKEEEEKTKKDRGGDEQKGSPDLSGLCGCLSSFFQAMASTDIEVSVEESSEEDTAVPDTEKDQDDQSDTMQETPPEDGTEAESAAEKQAAGPTLPVFALSLGGSYLFGQDNPAFDATARLALNVEFIHANVLYQYLGDTSGSSLHTLSANIGFVFPFPNVVAAVYAGVLWQVDLIAGLSFGIDLKVSFSDIFFMEISSLFAFNSPFYFIILSPSLNLAIDRFILGVGFNFYDYNEFIQYGPTITLGLWF